MAGLMNALMAAREQRLGERSSGETDHTVDVLLGECMENAAAIRDEFHARGIDCQVVGGALQNAYPPDEVPDSFAEAKADGVGVHYWVESKGYICELASESSQHYGEPVVVQAEPIDLGYIVFEDSYDIPLPY